MIGELFINDKDAYSTWRVTLEEGSYAKLLKPSDPKAYASNDVRSQPGLQVFNKNFQPKEREFFLVFWITTESNEKYLELYRSFMKEFEKGSVKLVIPKLKEGYYLRYNGCQEIGYHSRIGKVAIRFVEDNPRNRVVL